MRLLDTTTITLKEFIGNDIPGYTILSHTWGSEDVSFQDIQGDTATDLAGFAKIRMCCQRSAQDGFRYTWVDTCCIDKTSSSELSEVINSMYRWYREAAVCYVYLADVHAQSIASFAESRWFTRGWTLQELVAPSFVEFHNSKWCEIGTKWSLRKAVSKITGIHITVLDNRNVEDFSTAQRMYWASKRSTSRIEDTAYCLMGIFGVNMPMLYGEGENAFIRLQHEIIRGSADQSLFAWTATSGFDQWNRGLLASSPAEFVLCHNYKTFPLDKLMVAASKVKTSDSHSMTSKGVRIRLAVSRHSGDREDYTAVLNCQTNSEDGSNNELLFQLRLHDPIFEEASPLVGESGSLPYKDQRPQRGEADIVKTITRSDFEKRINSYQ